MGEQVGKKYGLKRGKENSQATHITAAEHKAKVIVQSAEQKRDEIDRQTEQKQAELDGLTQTVEAVTAIIQDDLKRTIHFAKNHNEEFLQTSRKDAEAKTKKELKENQREIETSEERIEKLDKIIESLYEDKVAGKISEERYSKMSDTYETEQTTLKERVKILKAEIEKAKVQEDKIIDFMLLIYKYSNFEELTPEILRSFIDKVIVHEKTKVNGHFRQTVEIIYNFVGAIEPSIFDDDYDN